MKRIAICVAMICAIMGLYPAQLIAVDARPKDADAMLQADLQLYDFYSAYSHRLEYCSSRYPELNISIEKASGVLSELLDDAVTFVRNDHHASFDFLQHDKDILLQVQKNIAGSKSFKGTCESHINKIFAYKATGLPEHIKRVVILNTERYVMNPENEFADKLLAPVQYSWMEKGRRRTCSIRIPVTWKMMSSDKRTKVMRSSLGYGIPFFSVTRRNSSRNWGESTARDELQRYIAVSSLELEYGAVEILAQGVQMLGDVPGAWVMFKSEGMEGMAAGFYYNWYIHTGKSVILYRSGVNEEGRSGVLVQEELFKRYYQTLREIALSTTIR